MASLLLTDQQSCADFFRRRIVLNLQYWCNHDAVKALDIAVLDQERDGIIKAISFGLDFSEAWSSVRELVIAFAAYMERRGHWEIWNGLLSQTIETAHQFEDLTGSVTLSMLFARLLQRQNRFKQAIAYYRRVIRLARQTGNRFEEARACTNLGFLYIDWGHWHRAEVLCCYALTLFEELGSDYGRAHTENHLGFLYIRRQLWDKAQKHLERACMLWQSMDDDHGLMRGFINLGLLYNEKKCPHQALNCLQEALHQAQLTGEEAEVGAIYMNIGIAYRLANEPIKAEAYARKAEAIFQRFSHLPGLAQVWGNLGMVYLDQRRGQEAISYLEASRKMWRDLKNQYGEIKVVMDMVEYELILGNWQEAAIRLQELEDLINRCNRDMRCRYLEPLLVKYRCHLAGVMPRPDGGT